MRAILARRTTLLIASTALVGVLLQLLGGSASRFTNERVAPSHALPHRDATRPQIRLRAAARHLTPAAASVLFAAAKRTADASRANDLFAPKSWYTPPPPPPPTPAALPEAVPTAPPLPYTFLGSYTNADNETVYFLSRDDRVYDVKSGDTLDQVYSVSVQGSELVFTYKPLNVRQAVPLGGGS